MLLVSPLRNHCLGQGHKDLLLCFKFILLVLMSSSLIYFELIFVCDVAHLHVDIHLFQHHLLKGLLFSHSFVWYISWKTLDLKCEGF